mgnify:CR=1 FL=1
MQEKAKEPEIRFAGFTGAWEQRKLGDIADITGGGTPSTSNNDYWDGNINWYSPAEISNQIFLNSSQRKITELGFSSCSAKMLPKGTVLFTSRAGIGKTAILSAEGCTNQGFQSIVPHANDLDSYFIFSRTNELKKYGEIVGAGSTFVEVSGKQMAAMTLMMPPKFNEQKTIGDFFKRLDSLLTLHQRKYEKLLNIKKSMLEKMFPKEGEVVPEIRFKGFTGAWEQRKIKDLAANTYGGGTPSTSNPDFWEGSIPWIQSSDLSEHNLFRVRPRKFISQAAVTNSPVKIIPESSIAVITRVGVGKLAVMNFSYTTSQDFLSLSNLNTDVKFTSYQLYRRLQKDLNAVQGTSIKGITKEELLGKNIFIPGRQEQEAIGKFFSKIDSLLTLHQRKLEMLKNVKQAFLEKMFV